MNPTLKVKLLPGATLPERKTAGAAGYDLCAYQPNGGYVISNLDRVTVQTGVFVEIPVGYFGLVKIRSGLGRREGLAIINTSCVIDSDYRGELLIELSRTHPKMDKTFSQIQHGERIAQLLILPHASFPVEQVDALEKTERGESGSTGK